MLFALYKHCSTMVKLSSKNNIYAHISLKRTLFIHEVDFFEVEKFLFEKYLYHWNCLAMLRSDMKQDR